MKSIDYKGHFSLVNKEGKLDVFHLVVNDANVVYLYITDSISGEVNVITLKDENLEEFVRRFSVFNL